MYLERRKYGNVAVIKCRGRLDGVASQRAGRALSRLIPPNARVLLDLTRMTHLSGTGLRALLLACRKAEAMGAVIALAGLPDEIRDIMAATGFLDLFTVAGTVSGGIDALGRGERAGLS